MVLARSGAADRLQPPRSDKVERTAQRGVRGGVVHAGTGEPEQGASIVTPEPKPDTPDSESDVPDTQPEEDKEVILPSLNPT